MTPEQINRMMQLRLDLINIIGFYDLMDNSLNPTPLQTMTYQVHFTASSVKVAKEMMGIINELLDDAGL